MRTERSNLKKWQIKIAEKYVEDSFSAELMEDVLDENDYISVIIDVPHDSVISNDKPGSAYHLF